MGYWKGCKRKEDENGRETKERKEEMKSDQLKIE